MNLTRINIENFKCFKKEQVIDIGRLTLLTGANSSGKSSLMYSILGSIQSGEFPYHFSTNGKYLNMGDFNEISFGHDEKAKIKIGYKFENGDVHEIQTTWVEDPDNKLPKLYELKVFSDYFSLNIRSKTDKYLVDFDYDNEKDTQSDVTDKILDAAWAKSNETTENGKRNNKFYSFINIKSISLKNLEIEHLPLDISMFKEHGIFRYQLILENILSLFRTFDEKLNFISSFRLHPERTYLETSKSALKVEKFGEGYLDQIIFWETKKAPQFEELVNIMKSLSLLEDIESKRMNGGRYEMQVKTKKKGVLTSLSDVGFGVSQFLPIIVADLQLPDDSMLFVAQPEIHLHPSVQASFGDYIIGQINKTQKSYIVETHSEYLINRIRLAIVKGELKEEDFHVYFLESTESDTIVHKIQFTKDGQILNAPPDFFKTYMMDVMEIAINAAG